MMVGSYDVRWDWDATQRLFLRSQLGSPHELADGQASANSVIVLVVPYGTSPAGGGPEAQTIGTGAAVVYTAGQKIEGTWTARAPPSRSIWRPAANRSSSPQDGPGSNSSTTSTTSPTADPGRPLPN